MDIEKIKSLIDIGEARSFIHPHGPGMTCVSINADEIQIAEKYFHVEFDMLLIDEDGNKFRLWASKYSDDDSAIEEAKYSVRRIATACEVASKKLASIEAAYKEWKTQGGEREVFEPPEE